MQPINNHPSNNKKRIIYIIVAILVAIAVTVGTVFVLNSFKVSNNPNTNNQTANTKADADALMTEAIQSLHSDPDKAKTLLEQAKKDYEAKGDTNKVIDINAQLFLLAHPTAK